MISPDLARIYPFEVVPALPESLKPLLEVAYNLWWTWHPEAVQLFSRLDRNLWRSSHHNPVRMLGSCAQETLDQAARDEGFLNALDRVVQNVKRHEDRAPWLIRRKIETSAFTVAYFCTEFGLTECLPIYSGGLGCLAGDHLKSASELGLPLVAVGLLYRNGYFQQYLSSDGWQQEYYPELDFANLPMRPVLDAGSKPVRVSIGLPGRNIQVGVWKVQVGRIALYLLDANQPDNDPADRAITSQLYGGDMEMRIKQEIVLGIGGIRALSAVGVEPDVFHMNEGHSAFLALERISHLIGAHNLSFDEARQYAAASHVFTTHTPVPAGIDRFPPDMINRYFRDYHDGLRLDMEGLLALGRENVFNKNEFFSMAMLAIRTSDWRNGVSKLHGSISRSMWKGIWPGVPENEVPITHVTNGVHARSWISGDLNELLNRYLGFRWQDDPADQSVWQAINEVPDEELWRVKQVRRDALVIWARRRLRAQLLARGASPSVVDAEADILNPQALTIGFARRFATYKRGNLLLRDPERLSRLLADAQRPVQIVIAGKAHPADGGGKDLIRQIVHFARSSQSSHRVVFLENYDIHVARCLVQGCDVWLNTPRRGMEASGTSGMKAALNGVLNCSILDGWWDEAYDNDIGWAIGRGESYANYDQQDDIESQALYQLLEQQIVPLFYDRDSSGIPRHWVSRMKRCIATLAPAFNTNRMVKEYAERLYIPSLRRARTLKEDSLRQSVAVARQKDRLRAAWGKLRIESVECDTAQPLGVRQSLRVGVVAFLDTLNPPEVRVQAYMGAVDNDGKIVEGGATDLTHEKDLGGGKHLFGGALTPASSGRFGFAVRIAPGGPMFEGVTEPGLILWDHAPTGSTSAAAVGAAV